MESSSKKSGKAELETRKKAAARETGCLEHESSISSDAADRSSTIAAAAVAGWPMLARANSDADRSTAATANWKAEK